MGGRAPEAFDLGYRQRPRRKAIAAAGKLPAVISEALKTQDFETVKRRHDPVPAGQPSQEDEMTTPGNEFGKSRWLRIAVWAVLALALMLLGIDAALASSDTTFSGPLDTVTDMVSGTGGQLAAALAVGAALVGSVLRFNATQLLGAVGVGVAAGAGTGIVTGLVGTAIV